MAAFPRSLTTKLTSTRHVVLSTLFKYNLQRNSWKYGAIFHPLSTNSVISSEERISRLSHLYLKDATEESLAEDHDYPKWLWQLKQQKHTFDELEPQSKAFQTLYRKKMRRDENERRQMKRF